ncbi:MAG: thioester reductase domain-containing protein [Deltaproteobacteria bacterium]|nr:thioester reductase domain-containing protein [Deltaproteobacteria bacterium]
MDYKFQQQMGLPDGADTLCDVLDYRAKKHGHETAFIELLDGEDLEDSISYLELYRSVQRVADVLVKNGAGKKRVLLVYPPGKNFLTGFLGCLCAGAIAVPIYPPEPSRLHKTLPRFQTIANDCQAEFALTTFESLSVLSEVGKYAPDLVRIKWIASDHPDNITENSLQVFRPQKEDIAFLQYTSGSTGSPKGVIVTHESLMLNFEMLSRCFLGRYGETTLSWLPNCHDMGLIEGLLRPLYAGCRCVMMSPIHFLKKPVRWLKGITKYRAGVSGAPNFAYDLCVRKTTDEELKLLDLSSWHTAFNGAEPVRKETVAAFVKKFGACGFDRRTMNPGYGLAEATLFISGAPKYRDVVPYEISKSSLEKNKVSEKILSPDDKITMISAGVPFVDHLVIVNHETCTVCAPDEVGEIWTSGPSMASGYWLKEDLTTESFSATLPQYPGRKFLRTGDLGFLREDHELFITGRLKDLIIIRGKNHYPQDIERTFEAVFPDFFRPGCTAAFSVDDANEEKLVVVQELKIKSLDDLPQETRAGLDFNRVIRGLEREISEKHGLQVYAVALIPAGSINKTSSGKIQRRATKKDFLGGTLKPVFEWRQGASQKQPEAPKMTADQTRDAIKQPPAAKGVEDDLVRWLKDHVARHSKISVGEVETGLPFQQYGYDSKDAMEIVGELEELLSRGLADTLLFDYPTIEKLAAYLNEQEGTHDAVTVMGEKRRRTDEPVAIIGMDCCFPGAANLHEFWQLLLESVDATDTVPADRWDADAYYDTHPQARGKTITKRGGFIKNVREFDATAYGISAKEAACMDPQQRLMLEISHRAFIDAGFKTAELGETKTGVFVGICNSDYGRYIHADRGQINPYFGTGTAFSIAANRISYWFNFKGPSVAIDTACSSSLVALHTALQSLRAGECQMAVCGGVNLILSPDVTINFSMAGVMAPDGRCKTFDERADGYARGEGAGAVVMMPLTEALKQNRRIYALIHASGVNNDGRSNGLMAPNGKAQEELLRAVYGRAGIAPERIAYIEAHGTGTALGDPIEVGAIDRFLGKVDKTATPCLIGSAKSNIGHLEAAAGVAGLIKTALSLYHKKIPASIHYQKANPRIPFDKTSLQVVKTVTAWPSRTEAVAGVSSFGFGGTNSHVVLGAHDRDQGSQTVQPVNTVFPLPIVLSAPHADLLKQYAQGFLDFLSLDGAPDPAQISYTSLYCREHHEHRLEIYPATAAVLCEELKNYVHDEPSGRYVETQVQKRRRASVYFVFPGQGPQSFNMGRELLKTSPVFLNSMKKWDAFFKTMGSWSLLEELARSEQESRINETWLTQPALFAIELALCDLLKSFSVVPDGIIGHSMGEVAAFCAAGCLTPEEAGRIIFYRGQLMHKVSGLGAMASVEMSRDEMEGRIKKYDGRVSIAAHNSPNNVVISGDPQLVNTVSEELTAQNVFNRILHVDLAAHSHHMDALMEEFERAVGQLTPRAPHCPLISSVTGELVTAADLTAGYWLKNLRQTVLFNTAAGKAFNSGADVFIEISPHPVLLAAITQAAQAQQAKVQVIETLHRKKKDPTNFMMALTKLYHLGRIPDVMSLYPSSVQPCYLPPFPADKKTHWFEISDHRTQAVTGQPLVGIETISPVHDGEQCFELDLSIAALPYIEDHKVQGCVVFPATGYLEMVGQAVSGVINEFKLKISAMSFKQALVLDEKPRRVHLYLKRDAGQAAGYSFKVFSRTIEKKGSRWILHAEGTAMGDKGLKTGIAPDITSVMNRLERRISSREHYLSFHNRGIDYGASFQGTTDLWAGENEALGYVRLPDDITDQKKYRAHPALLDACLQVMVHALPEDLRAQDDTFMPVGIKRFVMTRPPVGNVWSFVRLSDERGPLNTCSAEVLLMDDQGDLWGQMEGFVIKKVDQADLSLHAAKDWFYKVVWRDKVYEPYKTPDDVSDGLTLILGSQAAYDAPMTHLLLEKIKGSIFVSLGRETRLSDAKALSLNMYAPEQMGQVTAFCDQHLRQRIKKVVLLVNDQPDRLPDDPEALTSNTLDGCMFFLKLFTFFSARSKTDQVTITLVTNGAEALSATSRVSPVLSALWGMGRCLQYEYPDLWGGMIDVHRADDRTHALVIKEITAPSEEDQMILDLERRYVARLEKQTPLREGDLVVAKDKTHVVIGGLGAIGLHLVEALVRAGARYLVLTGRKTIDLDAPASAGDSHLQLIRDALRQGVIIQYKQADIAAGDSLSKAWQEIENELPPVGLVFNTAGVVTPKEASGLTRADFNDMCRSKVTGTWALYHLLKNRSIDRLILFSSGSAVWGSKLLTHYAAANHFLDGFTQWARACGFPALSVSWGMWGGGGMALGGEAESLLNRTGLKIMEPKMATQVLFDIIAHDARDMTVANIDWRILKGIYEQRERRRFLSEITCDSLDPSKGGQGTAESDILKKLRTAGDESACKKTIEGFVTQKALHLLGISIDKFKRECSLTEQGLDSLSASELKNAIEAAFGIKVNVLTLLKSENLDAVTLAIWEQVKDRLTQSDADVSEGRPAVLEKSISGPQDETLDPDIRPVVPYEKSGESRNIFMTGVTGYLGSFMLADLIRSTQATIYCHVRAKNQTEAMQRIQKTFADYMIDADGLKGRVVPVCGDLGQPRLGMSEEVWEKISSEVDCIIHAGFMVNFLFSYADLRAANVLGTQEILKLAVNIKSKPVHFISSFSVQLTPEYVGRTVLEDDPVLEGPGAYRQTKRASEKLVCEARARGIHASIYRPPFISWHTRTGVGNDSDFLIKLIKGCFLINKAPDLDLLFHLSPVDYVSRAILTLVFTDSAINKNYNIMCSETGTRWKDMLTLMNEAGAGIVVIPYTEWRKELSKSGDKNPLHVFFPVFSSDLPDKGSNVMDLFTEKDMPSAIDAANMIKALDGRVLPVKTDVKLVRTLVNRLKNT